MTTTPTRWEKRWVVPPDCRLRMKQNPVVKRPFPAHQTTLPYTMGQVDKTRISFSHYIAWWYQYHLSPKLICWLIWSFCSYSMERRGNYHPKIGDSKSETSTKYCWFKGYISLSQHPFTAQYSPLLFHNLLISTLEPFFQRGMSLASGLPWIRFTKCTSQLQREICTLVGGASLCRWWRAHMRRDVLCDIYIHIWCVCWHPFVCLSLCYSITFSWQYKCIGPECRLWSAIIYVSFHTLEQHCLSCGGYVRARPTCCWTEALHTSHSALFFFFSSLLPLQGQVSNLGGLLLLSGLQDIVDFLLVGRANSGAR